MSNSDAAAAPVAMDTTPTTVVEAAAPRVGSTNLPLDRTQSLVQKLVPDAEKQFTTHKYRGSIYKNPPLQHEISDPTTEISREELAEMVRTGAFEHLPVLVEHRSAGSIESARVGKVVMASYNPAEDQFEVEFRLIENGENSSAVIDAVKQHRLHELSLSHIYYHTDGKKRPIEVSLVEKGAREGCVLINASARAAKAAAAAASATTASVPEPGKEKGEEKATPSSKDATGSVALDPVVHAVQQAITQAAIPRSSGFESRQAAQFAADFYLSFGAAGGLERAPSMPATRAPGLPVSTGAPSLVVSASATQPTPASAAATAPAADAVAPMDTTPTTAPEPAERAGMYAYMRERNGITARACLALCRRLRSTCTSGDPGIPPLDHVDPRRSDRPHRAGCAHPGARRRRRGSPCRAAHCSCPGPDANRTGSCFDASPGHRWRQAGGGAHRNARDVRRRRRAVRRGHDPRDDQHDCTARQ